MDGQITIGSPEEKYHFSVGQKRCGCCCGAIRGEIFRAGGIKCFFLAIPVNAVHEQVAKRFKEEGSEYEMRELLSEVNIYLLCLLESFHASFWEKDNCSNHDQVVADAPNEKVTNGDTEGGSEEVKTEHLSI